MSEHCQGRGYEGSTITSIRTQLTKIINHVVELPMCSVGVLVINKNIPSIALVRVVTCNL